MGVSIKEHHLSGGEGAGFVTGESRYKNSGRSLREG